MKEKMKKIWDLALKNGKYVFPILVCAAVAITVVIALQAKDPRGEELEQIGKTIESSEETSETSSEAQEQDAALVKNEDPAIGEVINTYYNALAEGNETVINSVCDKVEELDMLWFLETSKYIEYYPELEIYTKPGFGEGETIVYVCFKVKLTGKETPYPAFATHYVCTAADGSLYIQRTSLSNDANEYLHKVSEQPDVVELTNRVKVEFDDLMKEEPTLLAYMNDVSEEVKRMVGVELGSQKGDEVSQENDQESQEGGEEGQGDSLQQDEEANVEEVIYAVASTTVNVRKSDSQKAEKIGRVTGGTKVQVLEQLVNGWSKIAFDNKEGYIMSKYLKVQESALQYTPIGKVKATDNINVRADASTDSSKIGTLVKGDEVDLLAVEGEWCKINFKGQIAYVKAEYVERTE
ncbi:MAG: SH3 domain-containing protein [Lachnospiraceae bacterium]|nr:SH3 domain-containing protein [Lachnospiraceae bacterium]